MNRLLYSVLAAFICFGYLQAQTVSDLYKQVNLDSLVKIVNEFSGEIPTKVNGNTVSLLNRQQANNDLAADYLVQKLQKLKNVTVLDQAFNAKGRNIVATQLGNTNPNNIYIISAHYDSVANYCADDNASGTAAILEIARILSGQCLENTIVYAFWDEEEIGLKGSNFYAVQAENNNTNILGVLNIDMMAFDSDNNRSFDIDVKEGNAGSISMANGILSVLNTYTFDLKANVVVPGTEDSDHSSFWNRGFPAVLVGEAWSENDQNTFYHTSNDRISKFNLSYYHELTKLMLAYMATKGGLLPVQNTITATENVLTANETSGTYQWFDCDTNLPISGETDRTFIPTNNGNYSVKVTPGSCSETSVCFPFNTLSAPTFESSEVHVYPNPVSENLFIDTTITSEVNIILYNISGKKMLSEKLEKKSNAINIKKLPSGIYFLKVTAATKAATYKIVKT